jgi:hypothetical protein
LHFLFIHNSNNHETLYTYLLLFFIGYEQEKVYQENIVASVAILKKLSDDWKEQATKLSPYEPLREILKNFRQKVVFQPSVCAIYSIRLLHLGSLTNTLDMD